VQIFKKIYEWGKKVGQVVGMFIKLVYLRINLSKKNLRLILII